MQSRSTPREKTILQIQEGYQEWRNKMHDLFDREVRNQILCEGMLSACAVLFCWPQADLQVHPRYHSEDADLPGWSEWQPTCSSVNLVAKGNEINTPSGVDHGSAWISQSSPTNPQERSWIVAAAFHCTNSSDMSQSRCQEISALVNLFPD